MPVPFLTANNNTHAAVVAYIKLYRLTVRGWRAGFLKIFTGSVYSQPTVTGTLYLGGLHLVFGGWVGGAHCGSVGELCNDWEGLLLAIGRKIEKNGARLLQPWQADIGYEAVIHSLVECSFFVQLIAAVGLSRVTETKYSVPGMVKGLKFAERISQWGTSFWKGHGRIKSLSCPVILYLSTCACYVIVL